MHPRWKNTESFFARTSSKQSDPGTADVRGESWQAHHQQWGPTLRSGELELENYYRTSAADSSRLRARSKARFALLFKCLPDLARVLTTFLPT